MSKLEGKTALITGGGTGIGKATAHLFAKEGAKVYITGRREEKLKEVQSEAKDAGIDINYIASDVSSESDCENVVRNVAEENDGIDILFNNAGILVPGTTHETPTDTWNKIFDINVKGTYFMSKFTIPHMLQKGSGTIVNNSSVVGLKGFPGLSAYVASKGAVTQLTKSMALEYADKGIRVNAICPGAIETPMVVEELFGNVEDPEATKQYLISLHPQGRLGKSEEIANAVLFLCDDNVGFMTGSMLSVDGGWIAN